MEGIEIIKWVYAIVGTTNILMGVSIWIIDIRNAKIVKGINYSEELLKRDGNGNIIIKEKLFVIMTLLVGNNEVQRKGYDVLLQDYEFKTDEKGFWLSKEYPGQKGFLPWEGEDMRMIYELFKDTLRPRLIERAMTGDGDYITVSEDGTNNRHWKQEEIEMIAGAFKKRDEANREGLRELRKLTII